MTGKPNLQPAAQAAATTSGSPSTRALAESPRAQQPTLPLAIASPLDCARTARHRVQQPARSTDSQPGKVPATGRTPTQSIFVLRSHEYRQLPMRRTREY
uniref:Uncharacterized protein n=1 Tax=Xanthomonas phage fSU1 TaxID=3238781 RepID=A0AB39CEJ4_9VIRU